MMRSLIGVWFDNIWLGVPAHNHTHVDLPSDSGWLLGISFLDLFNEKKKGGGAKTVLLFNPLLILGQVHSGVNTPLVLYLTQNMSLENSSQKINQQSASKLKIHKNRFSLTYGNSFIFN